LQRARDLLESTCLISVVVQFAVRRTLTAIVASLLVACAAATEGEPGDKKGAASEDCAKSRATPE
jgi:hypothetical protein